MKLLQTFALLLAVGFAAPALACPLPEDLPPNSICIEWQAPVENVDGSAIPATGPGSLTGFRLFYSTTQGSFNIGDSLLITDPTLTEFTTADGQIVIPRPTDGFTEELYLVLTAINTESEESGYSNTVMRTLQFPIPVPGSPAILEVVVPIFISG